MKSIQKVSQRILIFLSALVFVTMMVGPSFGSGPVMKINPKEKKQIKIGVLDPNAGIEIAGWFNREHKAAADKRKWQIQFFDLKSNIAEGPSFMENMISAGFDGIILHWNTLKSIDKQLKMAFDKGIPVITVANIGERWPGVLAEVGPMEATMAATSTEYMAGKLQAGDKIITISIPIIEMHQVRLAAIKGVAQAYGLKIAADLQWTPMGDPFQWAKDQTKNTLLGDTKKEIKGIAATWEGMGVTAARAAHELGRDDVVVVTVDDSPNTYNEIRNLPTMWAGTGFTGQLKEMNDQIFTIFEKVFKGDSVPSQQFYPFLARMVTKENLPPKGYFMNPLGYKGRKPDFQVK